MGWITSFFEWLSPKEVEVRLSAKYFSDKELNCNGSGGLKLAPEFDEMLYELRRNVGEPMIVTSCCRSRDYNKKVGGHNRSLHVYDYPAHPTGGTCAIDIRRKSKLYDLKLILEAWELGFSIGLHPAFLHFDARTDVLGFNQAVFSYGSTDKKELNKIRKMVGLG